MTTEMQEEVQEGLSSAPPSAGPNPAKSANGLIIGGILAVILLAGATVWWLHSQTYEDTDDAQIDGHLNPTAARVAGTIKAVYVEDNQYVVAGQPLVDLDTADYEITLAQTRAQYDQALAELRGEQPNLFITRTSNTTDAATSNAELTNADAALAAAQHDYASDLSQLQQAEANNAKAQSDLARYQQLIDKHEVAQSDYDQYNAAAKAQAASVAAQKENVAAAAKIVEERQAQLNEQHFKLDQTIQNAPRQLLIRSANIQAKQANLESIQARLKQDQLNVSYCRILAPVSGLVSQRSAEVGARISAGEQLMMLVQTSDLWVTANFKETQLKKIRVGQAVSVKVDALDKTFNGFVESLPAATGDRSSALPPENATGNFVKVVQRLGVRIRFKKDQDGLKDLRPGMSVVPTVHFGD